MSTHEAELHVDSVEGDRWTWRYVEPRTGVDLYSNEIYATREGAAEKARRAYPDVPFADNEDEPAGD